MKKLLYFFLCFFVSTNPINAKTPLYEVDLFANKANISIDNPDQYPKQLEILAKIAQDDINNVYYHRIKEVDVGDRSVYLEDNSKWDIGWWYSDVILDWEENDRVTVSYTMQFNGFGIQNLDKGSLAWSSIWRFNLPTAEHSDSVVEVDTSNPDFSSVITLKSGFQFGIPTFWFFGPSFSVGDSIFVFKNDEYYLISNLTNGSNGEYPTLLKVGNPDWRREGK